MAERQRATRRGGYPRRGRDENDEKSPKSTARAEGDNTAQRGTLVSKEISKRDQGDGDRKFFGVGFSAEEQTKHSSAN